MCFAALALIFKLAVFSSTVFDSEAWKTCHSPEHHIWQIWENTCLQFKEVQSLWWDEWGEYDRSLIQVRHDSISSGNHKGWTKMLFPLVSPAVGQSCGCDPAIGCPRVCAQVRISNPNAHSRSLPYPALTTEGLWRVSFWGFGRAEHWVQHCWIVILSFHSNSFLCLRHRRNYSLGIGDFEVTFKSPSNLPKSKPSLQP